MSCFSWDFPRIQYVEFSIEQFVGPGKKVKDDTSIQTPVTIEKLTVAVTNCSKLEIDFQVETVDHLFNNCSFASQVWNLTSHSHTPLLWNGGFINWLQLSI